MQDRDSSNNRLLQRFTADELLQIDESASLRYLNGLQLEEQAALVLSAPWAQRMKLMLLSKNLEALVQLLPEEEIYWTIKEIEEVDALPLFTRISPEQLQYIIDIECWNKDRIEIDRVRVWLRQLLRCKETKVMEWLTSADDPLLAVLFKKLFTVYKLSEDSDLTEAYDHLPSWTLDGVYYFQFADDSARLLVIPFLHLLYQNSNARFCSIMESLIQEPETELEEESLHLRQSRIAEKGFPELDEALDVYQYIGLEEMELLLKQSASSKLGSSTDSQDLHPVLRYSFANEAPFLFFHTVLRQAMEKELAERIQCEIVHISNKVMIADCLEVREALHMHQSLGKVAGYINISLEILSEKDIAAALNILNTMPMQYLFRYGYSQALALRDRAKKLCRDIWPSYKTLRPHFLDSPWGETFEGLDRQHPLFFEGSVIPGKLEYREFRTCEEISSTAHILNIVETIVYLIFKCIVIDVYYLMEHVVQLSTLSDIRELKAITLFNTILAQHILYGKTVPDPLTGDDLKKLLPLILKKQEINEQISYIIKPELHTEIAAWLYARYHIEESRRPELKDFVCSCLDLLQDECVSLVDQQKIDTRYFSSLLIRKKN